MPTPSIQTLRNDAQQVLNLDSISAVRSVVAATLANANAGTPLNPNLTTQQLWNEFYQIVTQPKSDIESIIANQLMKFLYSPPAPGGAGADKQVIFNDGGVLAGDPGLTFDKVTNALTISGAANFNGGALAAYLNGFLMFGSSGNVLNLFAQSSGFHIKNNSGTYPLLTLNNSGDFTVQDGAGSGRLVLNSTGLGVGVSPAAKFDSLVADAAESARFRAASGWLRVFGYVDATDKAKIQATNNTNTALQTLTLEGLTVRFNTNGGTALNLNANGAAALLGASTSANGVGITFPATQVASTDANTLDDYEEGTWTPTVAASSGTPNNVTIGTCKYTKIGRQVIVTFDFVILDKGTASGSFIFSLPFASDNFVNCGSFRENGLTGNMGQVFRNSTSDVAAFLYNNATVWVDGYKVLGTYSYCI